jgi:alkyl hydroperoxide reductase subunit AhpC
MARSVKIVGLSVDPVDNHKRWSNDIKETQGTAPDYSMTLQLTAKHKVATPVNWKHGEDVIIAGSVSDDDARKIYPQGWKAPKPYLRIVSQPKA